MNAKQMTSEDVSCGSWDWKEVPEVVCKETVEAINRMLKQNGRPLIYAYPDPFTEGSDSASFLFSPRRLTKKQVKKLSDEGWGL